MDSRIRLFSIVLCLFFAVPAPAAEKPVVGSIKIVKGAASVQRDGLTIAARVGERLFANDILLTGEDGSLGIIFRDDSVLSMGPETRLIIDKFVFAPAEGKLGMVTKILKGTVAYFSGIIGKLSPESARFETPVASIGIRGTRFAVKVD